MTRYAAYIEWDPETKQYMGFIPEVHGAHSQGVTLDELMVNLKEALILCLEEGDGKNVDGEPSIFIGVHTIEV